MAALFSTGELLYVGVMLIAACAVVSLLIGVRYLLAARRDRVQDRLQRTVGFRPAVADGGISTEQKSLLETALQPFAKVATPTTETERGRLRSRLQHAGLRSERALIKYLGTKVVLCLVFAGGFLTYNALRPQELELTNAAFFTIFAMAAGFYLPSFWLMSRIKERQSAINRTLPNALDLMVTCVEAGLGVDAAMNRVADELHFSAPILSREMATAALEMRAGVSRSDAFRRLAERTGVEDLRNLAAIIIQTQIFGTSVAKSLRIQAESIRVRRMYLAEERAAAASVKMTLPLVLCIAPALFAVLLGPAAVSIYRLLLPTLTGGG